MELLDLGARHGGGLVFELGSGRNTRVQELGRARNKLRLATDDALARATRNAPGSCRPIMSHNIVQYLDLWLFCSIRSPLALLLAPRDVTVLL